jgi:hypothetical protein
MGSEPPEPAQAMTAHMRKTLARLPYAEKLRRVAELIEFTRRFKAVKEPNKTVGSTAR